MKKIEDLKIKIYADGANKSEMIKMYQNPLVKGLTTNPSLMKRAGISNYELFCKDILSIVKNKSLSVEVFSDDFAEMERQAIKIASWGDNVFVKIPITNTKREACYELVNKLVSKCIKVNVTALMTIGQVSEIINVLNPEVPSYVSIFAGRIADTGRDPIPIMRDAAIKLGVLPQTELIWASPRELINIFQADSVGCQIITVSTDILSKLHLIGYDLNEYSLDTVKMFYRDAKLAGYNI